MEIEAIIRDITHTVLDFLYFDIDQGIISTDITMFRGVTEATLSTYTA